MKAAIFDFDGTIVDTETLWVDVYKQLIYEKYNAIVPLTIFEQCVGTKDTILYTYLTESVDSSITREYLSPLAERLVNEKINDLVPRAGVVELIHSLHKNDFRIAISSGSKRKWIDQFLTQHHLAHYFELIRCADDVTYVKPHPELYLKTLEGLQLHADQCFAIEDSYNGSAAAIKAGLTCYVVPNEVTALTTFPEQVIRLNHFEDFRISHLST